MTGPGFEDRCRRLLRWYPPQHRREHEDEMLAVMLATARPGQRRPSRRETTDIIMGGIRVRLRRTFGRPSAPQWRDAFALTAVLGTILLLAESIGWVSFAAIQLSNGWALAIMVVPIVAFSTSALAAAVSLWAIATRHRRTAIAATWALAAVILAWTAGYNLIIEPETWSANDLTYYPPYLAIVVTAAQTLTTDARHAAETLGRRRILAFIAIAVLAAAGTPLPLLSGTLPHETLPRVLVISLPVAALAVAAGLAARSPVGRHTLALLAVPLIAFLTRQIDNAVLSNGWSIGLVALLVASLAFTGSLRTARR